MKKKLIIDVNQDTTNDVIAALERGVAPWQKPWSTGAFGPAINLNTGNEYRGINALLLMLNDHGSSGWLTFKQAKALAVTQAKASGRKIEERESVAKNGKKTVVFWDVDKDELFKGGVRKGEKSTSIVYFNWLYKDKAGKPVKKASDADTKYGFWKRYNVFNVEQCDGIETPSAPDDVREHEPLKECEKVVEAMPLPPSISHGGGRACYRPDTDAVQMPRPELFASAEEYYSTLFHELAHATGHSSRLNREGITGKARAFGSGVYSKEELVAEMTACFLCRLCRIDTAVIDNSAAYLASWIKVLKGDSTLVIKAASAAQKAYDYITNVKWEN